MEKEFRQFAHDFDFVHTTSSPHFHQSNGFIEAMVKKVKNAFKKMDGSPNVQTRALLQLCDLPSQQRFYMVIHLKEQSFQDHPKGSIYIRSGRDSSNSKKNRKMIGTVYPNSSLKCNL